MSRHAAKIAKIINGFSHAQGRWARLGPYYAMFPMEFACNVVADYSKQGDFVLDPFAGRGSGTFAAAALARKTFGIEINPVGWLYSTVKMCPASQEAVIKRLIAIIDKSSDYQAQAKEANEFFRMCFSGKVFAFLLAARDMLDWKTDNADSTLMAILLHYLHGKRGAALSNQMPMAKSTSINYSIDWWKSNGYDTAPEINVSEFFQSRIRWRYAKGRVDYSHRGSVILNDSTQALKAYCNKATATPVDLLFTSPPYYGVTNYHVDQWLRIWLLGGEDKPTILDDKHKKRFASKIAYEELLDDVFCECAKIMSPKGIVYIRTDCREYTLKTTKAVLNRHFPDYSLEEKYDCCVSKSQSQFLNNVTGKVCEVDLILTP